MTLPKNIIFDCDGVLVDSEIIANRIESEFKTSLGFPITTQEHICKFVGLSEKHPIVRAELQRLPTNYLKGVDRLIQDAYETDLKPVAGVPNLLAAVEWRRCVDSNSHPD